MINSYFMSRLRRISHAVNIILMYVHHHAMDRSSEVWQTSDGI